ncbi:MAG: toll/interleukin-1 receptor domain-containing protein [Candidatus Krumholzibacteriota bacterium]|nr:toll/interleukin-1 receptor domain-containing protein [Candidatus Krumholzibacteriota bacterium]
MTEVEKTKPAKESDTIVTGPLVFISHDSRDADLAEAFSKLLKSVSAGMIKTFRSSDKKAGDGIDFGEEWYKRLMTQLQATSDVVCLFTERSLDRPWILFEAGVAKGKLDTPVIGVALGVPLSRVSAGPFYQFQNMDDEEEDLTKLVNQLARRVPGLELDSDVVKSQVHVFKETEKSIVESLGTVEGQGIDFETSSVAKLIEEMKTLPSRVAERLIDENPLRRRGTIRKFHPMMFEDLIHMSGKPGDPVSILLAASVLRDDMPWLYELAMEVYRAVKTGDAELVEEELHRLRDFSEMMMRGPFMEEFGFVSKEYHMMAIEFPRMLERSLRHMYESTPNKPAKRKRKLPPNNEG